MNYIYHFDVAAIFLNIMLIFIILTHKTYPTKPRKFYIIMVCLNLISSISDFISAFTISFPEDYSLVFNYTINITYLASHNLTAVFFMLYILVLSQGKKDIKKEMIFWISLVGLELLAVISTPFHHLLFYFDNNLVYKHGILMYFFYFAAIIILLNALYIFLTTYRTMNKFQILSNAAFLSILLFSVVFQKIFSNILIENFCISIAFIMMNEALDNPAMYFHNNTNCFNQTAFDTMLKDKLNKGKNISIVAFTFIDMPVLRKTYGEITYNSIMNYAINLCHQIFGYKRVFYLSNDTFAITMDSNDPNDIIEKMSSSIDDNFSINGDNNIPLTPHFCILRYPGEAQTVGEINLVLQDMLSHTFRKTGLRVISDTSQVLEAKHREDEIIHILHNAISNEGFEIYYQPIYDWRNNCYPFAEALIRLNDFSFKVFPDEFIPIAEQNGMILEIDEIVLKKVCEHISKNNIKRFGLKQIHVNLSILHLLQSSAMKRLYKICHEFNVSPEYINFEITETATFTENDSEIINESINYLMEQGFSISLDDYGSGYSNISYLAEMPFSVVKIDKNILWQSMKKERYNTVLESSIKLVSYFNNKCIVEGVETEEMASKLRNLGCDYFQGYLYSRPISEQSLIEFLENKTRK